MCEVLENRVTAGSAATAFPAATSAGLETLRAGGNAIDAAAAAAWALAVCEPSGSGLGGKTVLLVRLATGKTLVIDGRSRAPVAVSRKRISGVQQKSGYLSCTIPTTVAVLGHAQRCYGTLSLSRVMAPAIALAEDGYVVTPLHRRQLKWCLARLQATTPASKLFLDDGRLPQVGQLRRQPALARTLHRLARAGTEDFYMGQVARAIVDDMDRHGGLIKAEDLAKCARPAECKPLSAGYRRHRVLSVPPPGGGLQLLLALKVLEHFRSDELVVDAIRWYDALSRVVHAVFQDREHWSVTPERLTPSVRKWMLSDERAAEIFAAISASPAAKRMRIAGAEGPGETTHLCTADGHGNVVSLSQSIQSLFGARVACEELGFLYNNCLSTCPRYDHPYQLASRCLPRSNMAPTLVLKTKASGMDSSAAAVEPSPTDDVPLLALGAAGSRRIISSILHVISGVVDLGLPLAEAVGRPRVHVTLDGRAHVEKTAATPELQEHLLRRFGRVRVRAAGSHYMGAVQAIQRDANGRWIGAADPRRDGNAADTGAADLAGEPMERD